MTEMKDLKVFLRVKDEIEAQLLCLGFLTTLDRLGLSPPDQQELVAGAEEIFKHDFLEMTENERLEFCQRVAITMAGAAALEYGGEGIKEALATAARVHHEEIAKKRAEAQQN